MNKASRTARALTRTLTTLTAVAPHDLPRVAGGAEMGSTSTSGRPEAGDDTIGDHIPMGGWINNHGLTRLKGPRR